jgi:hypothetical protein
MSVEVGVRGLHDVRGHASEADPVYIYIYTHTHTQPCRTAGGGARDKAWIIPNLALSHTARLVKGHGPPGRS